MGSVVTVQFLVPHRGLLSKCSVSYRVHGHGLFPRSCLNRLSALVLSELSLVGDCSFIPGSSDTWFDCFHVLFHYFLLCVCVLINGMFGFYGWQTGGTPEIFHIEGNTITKPKEVAEAQHKFYSDKAKKLKDNLPPPTYDPLSILQAAFLKWDPHSRPMFSLKEISISETRQLFDKLGNNNSFGHEGIDATAIKAATEELILPVMHVINLSLRTATFPNT